MSPVRVLSALSIVCVFSSAVSTALADDTPSPSPPLPPSTPPASSPSPSPLAPSPYDPPRAAARPASSIHMTLEATQSGPSHEEPPAASETRERSPHEYVFLHGFRVGYGHVMRSDQPSEAFGGKTLEQQAKIRVPHHMLIGYEVFYRVLTRSWLNVLLVANGTVAGLEQSRFLPSGNFIVGAELMNSFQIGVGANISPLKGNEAHTVLAAGWTPRVGTVYTPVHVHFVPDVEGMHRIGITTGVTF